MSYRIAQGMGATGGDVSIDAKNEDKQDMSFWRLFRFAKWYELLAIVFALFCAALCAASKPVILIIYGEFTTLLIDRALTRGEVSSTKLLHLLGGAEVM